MGHSSRGLDSNGPLVQPPPPPEVYEQFLEKAAPISAEELLAITMHYFALGMLITSIYLTYHSSFSIFIITIISYWSLFLRVKAIFFSSCFIFRCGVDELE